MKSINILITYFSQTGNTGRIAEAMKEELSTGHIVTLEELDRTDVSALKKYDLVFIGSPCHAGDLAAPVTEFLSGLPTGGGFAMAGFITHSSSVYQKESYEGSIESISKKVTEKNISYLGTFDCQGYLTPELHDFVRERKGISPGEWKDLVKKMEGHPNSEDFSMAKKFARNTVSLLRKKMD